MKNLKDHDVVVEKLIGKELNRIEHEVNLIASENYTHPAVLEATGSIFTTKYAEGYPKKRYYAGCSVVDEIESLAIKRCQELFGAEHINVQPHSGSQANMGIYFSALQPGDTILGMDLSAGGHLTHGYKMNFSGTLYRSVFYGVDKETEHIDYEALDTLAEQHKPKLIIVGASAYSRTIDFKRCAAIAHKHGAYFMADIAHIAGLIATGLHPSPIGCADFVTSTTHKTLRGPRGGLIMTTKKHGATVDKRIMPGMQGGPLMHVIAAKAVAFHLALQPEFRTYQEQVIKNAQAMAHMFTELGYRIVSGGTDNHLFIVDLRSKNSTGAHAEKALEHAGIFVNRNCIPFDPEKPLITSGIRVGTPAITTRGMKEAECIEIVHAMHDAMSHKDHPSTLKRIKKHMKQLCLKYPVYPSLHGMYATPSRLTAHHCPHPSM